MKIREKLLTTFLAILTFMATVAGFVSPHFIAHANDVQDETEVIEDSMFLIDIDYLFVDNEFVYVYDNSDKTIKIIDSNTGAFKKQNNHFREIEGVKAFVALSNNLIMLTDNNSLKVASLDTLRHLSVNCDIENMQNFKDMKLITSGSKQLLLLCPKNPAEAEFVIANIDINDTSVNITTKSSFSVSGTYSSQISDYKSIFASTDGNALTIMFVTVSNIFSIYVDLSSVSNVTTITEAKAFKGGLELSLSEVLNLSIVTFSGKEKAIVTTKNKIEFYDLTLEPTRSTFNLDENYVIEIEQDFDATNACGNNAIIALSSRQNQVLRVFTLNELEGGFLAQSELKNPEITINELDMSNFEYLTLTDDINLLETPFSRESIINIPKDSHIAIIGTAVDQNGQGIIGWRYCMYTAGNKNYYGFVEDINTANLEKTTYEKKYVLVIARSELYSMPSLIVDERSKVVTKIQESSRLEVLSSLDDYTGGNEQYLLVKVNGDKVGFVRRSRILEFNATEDRIVTNANIISNDVQVFTTTGSDKQTILRLSKGSRVRVVGRRNEIPNYTKITFNDEEGNVYTGYVYTYNISADSWSTVQIIGMILVAVNVILLVVIVLLKNRLTR